MALNYGKLKAAGVPQSAMRVSKLVKDRKLPSLTFNKVKVIKDKVSKAFDFNKFTKKDKLAKAPKIALLKKAIKKVK